MGFSNVYDDAARAAAYATLEFPGTYHLAFRDIPGIVGAPGRGRRALDFGCGAGRSSRFLKRLGFDVTGIDIAESMVRQASAADPGGAYRCVAEGDFSGLAPGTFDLVLSAFAFDNIPDADNRRALLAGLRDLLAPGGRIVVLGSTPEIYTHEWASFTTRAFPENRHARSGEQVRIVMKDVPDARPIVDLVWFAEDYARLFAAAGLAVIGTHHPLGRPDEPYAWLSETSVPPWVIYVLEKP